MDSGCPLLTRTRQPFEKLGEELIALACQRIEGDNISLPGRVLPTPFIGGGTTRKEENDLLGITKPSAVTTR
jgi:DNA-binding LacI/PurR family transcriptional regulator